MLKKIIRIADGVIYWSFAALFFVTPLIVVPYTSELFEFNKMFFVYGITIIVFVAWLVRDLLSSKHVQGSKFRARGELRGEKGEFWEILGFRVKKTPLDLPILLFVLSQVLATLFSIDRYLSVWGYYSRQNGGLLSVISYSILYYSFVSNFSLRNPKSKILPVNQSKAGFRTTLNRIYTGLGPNSKHENFEKLSLFRTSNFESRIYRLLYLGLASGVLVALYGIAQHFGIDEHLWVQDVKRRIFSTLGQPNWLAAYMAVLAMVALGISFSFVGRVRDGDRKVRKLGDFRAYLFLGLAAVFYLVILYTKSRSGLLGFWVGNVVFWLGVLGSLGGYREIYGMLAERIREKSGKIKVADYRIYITRVFIGFQAVLLLITFVVGVEVGALNKFTLAGVRERLEERKVEKIVIREPGTALETGGTESGKIRKYVWKGALNAWRENPIFGTGVGTFAWAFYRYKPVGHNATSEWDFLYNKAHNEYLNYLAASGLAGLLGYLGILGVFGGWAVKEFLGVKGRYGKIWENMGNKGVNRAGIPSDLLITHYPLLITNLGLFSGWVTLLVTNFFGFSVVVTNLYFWILPGIILGSTRMERIYTNRTNEKENGFGGLRAVPLRIIAAGAVVVIGGVLLFVLGRYWYADVVYKRGQELVNGGYLLEGRRVLGEAVNLRPGEPIYKDELGYVLGLMAVSAFEQGERDRVVELTRKALTTQSEALQTSPSNLNFVKTRVRLYYLFAQNFGNREGENGSGKIKDEEKVESKGFLDLAIAATEYGVDLAPKDPKLKYNLALLYASYEDENGTEDIGEDTGIKKAVEALNRALELKPDYRDARIALGLFYQELGEEDKAAEQFRYILDKINPEDRKAKEYLNEISGE